MTQTMSIGPEPPKRLSVRAEMDVLRNALVCNPESAALRLRLAMLFNELDRFGGTIALLSAAVRLEFEELLVQSAAYFARSAPGDADP